MGATEKEEERSSKRQRMETNESNDFVFDKDLHFDDGNIILVTEGTAFKIHKGVLSRHSVFFRDMFLRVNDDQSSELEVHEDCEVLRLSDSKQDMVCLLQALYDVKVPSSDEPLKISCLLRISDKYVVHHLLKRILKTVEQILPITYGAYSNTYESLSKISRYGRDELIIGVTAITAGIDIFLPTLYYHLSTSLDPKEFEMLPASSIAKILIGIKPAVEYLPQVLQTFKTRHWGSDACRSHTCRHAWKAFITKFESYMTNSTKIYHPIQALLRLCTKSFLGECVECKNARIEMLDAEAKTFWDRLPNIYNVAQSWDELQERYKLLLADENNNGSQRASAINID